MGTRPAGLVAGERIDLGLFRDVGLELRGERSLLFFERGHWCPVCVRHLGELAASAAALRDVAPRIAVVTHETAPPVGAAYPFPVVPDPNLLLAVSLDLVHIDEFGKRTIRPGTLLLDRDGTILYSYVGDDSRDRPTINALLLGFSSLEF